MFWRCVGLVILFMLIAQPALAVGFQERSATDTDGKPLRLAIWYPSDTPPSAEPTDGAGQALAVEGAISAGRYPLIVISHGSGGSLRAHADTAYALADAGYIVVAVAHNGNTRDDDKAPRVQYMMARPRQVSRAIDYMLGEWQGRQDIAPQRIGIFGFSLGGYTALVAAGAVPDPATAARRCRTQPQLGCPSSIVRDFATPAYAAFPASVHGDSRIKAAIAAAPSYGWMFDTKSLAGITIPIQLWIAEQDRAPELTALSKRLPKPPELHRVNGVGHMAFARPCNRALEPERKRSCVDSPNFDQTKFHQEMNGKIRAFFDRTL